MRFANSPAGEPGVRLQGSLLQSDEWDAIVGAGLRYETRRGRQEVFRAGATVC